MAGGSYDVDLQGRKFKVTQHELSELRKRHLRSDELDGRMSEIMWLDIYIWEKGYGIIAQDVLRTIRDLEKGETTSRVKPATEFKRAPLKGFWHKHVFTAHFIPKNLANALGRGRLREIVTDVVGTDESPFTVEKMVELRDRLITEPFAQRQAENGLTGEWIVYLPHEGKNYYLCLGTHRDSDQFIYDRIMENCPRDFPELPAWLKAAGGA